MDIIIRKTKCPKCGTHRTWKNGYNALTSSNGKAEKIKQYFKCADCGHQYHEIQKWDEKKGDYVPVKK